MLDRVKANFPRNWWAETGAEALILLLLYSNGKFGTVYSVMQSIGDHKTPAAGDFIWAALVMLFIPLFFINISRICLGLLFALGWVVIAVYDLGTKTQVMDLVIPQPIGMTVFSALGWGTFLFLLPTAVGFIGGLLRKVAEEEAPAAGGGDGHSAGAGGGGDHAAGGGDGDGKKSGFSRFSILAGGLLLLLVFGPLVYFGIQGPKAPEVGAGVRATPTPTVSPPAGQTGSAEGAGAAGGGTATKGGVFSWFADRLSEVGSLFSNPDPEPKKGEPKGEYCTKTVSFPGDGTWTVRAGNCLGGDVSWGSGPNGPWYPMRLDGEVYSSTRERPWGMLCFKTASAVYCNTDAGARTGVFSFAKQ